MPIVFLRCCAKRERCPQGDNDLLLVRGQAELRGTSQDNITGITDSALNSWGRSVAG